MKNMKINNTHIKHLFRLAALLIVISVSQLSLYSQTCSCAGTPLFDPIEYSTLKDRNWRFELSYKYHAINDLVEGTEEVIDDTDRERKAQALLLDVQFALSRRLTIRSVFSLTRQGRDVGISASPPVHTQGFGDGMLTLQYAPLYYSDRSRTEIAIGAGVKVPMGDSTAETVGIASEDMQPGTGSWDFVGWAYAARIISSVKGLEVFAGFSTRFNGANERGYSFGDEIVSSLGARLRTGKLIDVSLYGRYRWAGGDKRFDSDIPNTGGQWVYLIPSVTVNVSRNIGVKTEVEIPLYRKVNGFRQFTTSYLVSFSLVYFI
jgi:hypothetical protein